MGDNEEIFRFINPEDNDQLSDLKKSDLEQLLTLLDDYYLSLRKKLGFSKNTTFGFEIEFEIAMEKRMERELKKFKKYYEYRNNELNSINADLRKMIKRKKYFAEHEHAIDMGGEISTPILRNTEKTWRDLKSVCDLLKSYSADAKHCGGHIHIGANILNENMRTWINFIKLWFTYEDVIFRFGYGEFLTERPQIQEYAAPSWFYLHNDYKMFNDLYYDVDLQEIIEQISKERDRGVNFSNVSLPILSTTQEGNTIEFRCPNGSLDPTILQNNANFFIHLLLYSKSPNYNDSIIFKRNVINEEHTGRLLEIYREIHLESALELADMIFSNNLDKIYFLRQYVKSFEIGDKPLTKAKKFTID